MNTNMTGYGWFSKIFVSPTLRCVLQLRISCPQWAVFNGVKGQTSVIVQSDPSLNFNQGVTAAR